MDDYEQRTCETFLRDRCRSWTLISEPDVEGPAEAPTPEAVYRCDDDGSIYTLEVKRLMDPRARELEGRLKAAIPPTLSQRAESLYVIETDLDDVGDPGGVVIPDLKAELEGLAASGPLPDRHSLTDDILFREGAGGDIEDVVPLIEMSPLPSGDTARHQMLKDEFQRHVEGTNNKFDGEEGKRALLFLVGESGLVDPVTAQTREYVGILRAWFEDVEPAQRDKIDMVWATPGYPISSLPDEKLIVSRTLYRDEPNPLSVQVWPSS